MKALLLAPMGSVHRRFNNANIDALIELGYEVHLVANFNTGDGAEKQNREYTKECENIGVKIHSIPFLRHSLIGNLTVIKEVRKLIQDNDFDIVHAHTETGGLILRLVGKSGQNTKYVYTPHGMSFYKGSSIVSQLIYRPVERWICSMMVANIAINHEEYNVLNNWNPDSANLVHGVGLKFSACQNKKNVKNVVRQELNIPLDDVVVLSVGELNNNKNHSVVIKALSKIRQDNIWYVLCGAGANKDKLLSLAKKCGIEKRVLLLGYRTDILKIITASDIFAFPSIHEGLPVSLTEAMAGGLPVVCSNIRGNNDLIENNKGGFLISKNNPEKYAEKIKEIITEESLSKEFGLYNLKAVQRFSYDNVKCELREIYNGLFEQK